MAIRFIKVNHGYYGQAKLSMVNKSKKLLTKVNIVDYCQSRDKHYLPKSGKVHYIIQYILTQLMLRHVNNVTLNVH